MERLHRFWNEEDKFSLALKLLENLSGIALIGPNASYISSCLKTLLSSAKPMWQQLSPDNLSFIFRVGYEVQSEFLGDIIEEWLQYGADRVALFTCTLMSSDFLWTSSSFAKFEARIIGYLTTASDDLSLRVKEKFLICDTSLASMEAALFYGKHIAKKADMDAQKRKSLQTGLNVYLQRCRPFLERTLKDEGMPDEIWHILPEFILQAEDIDLEKWLGRVCKRDLDYIIPKANRVIKSILDKDINVFHRALSGWIVRTFSRLTRRFAEDEILDEATLLSIEEFGTSLLHIFNSVDLLIDSIKYVESIRSLMETKASYIETMMLAAITQHLGTNVVSRLLITMLSSLRLTAVNDAVTMLIIQKSIHNTHLLQRTLGYNQSRQSTSKTIVQESMSRVNVATIIYRLFMMDPPGNSSESVLIGILSLYTGSLGPADVLLRDVLDLIDSEKSLSVISSSDAWNAFRSSRSRIDIETFSSSLESPFSLIDSETTRRNIFEFDVNIGNSESSYPNDNKVRKCSTDKAQDAYHMYDPKFWLSIIGYCLEKVVHSSNITHLIENFATGYAIVCLSSYDVTIRMRAGSILVRWEYLCEVSQSLKPSNLGT